MFVPSPVEAHILADNSKLYFFVPSAVVLCVGICVCVILVVPCHDENRDMNT